MRRSLPRLNRPLFLFAALLLAACAAASESAGALVRVEADGQTRLIHTRQTSPYAILATLGLNVSAEDEVWVDGARWEGAPPLAAAPASIVVRRAVTISVVDGATPVQLQSAAPTVGAALARAGYRLYLGDAVTPPLAAPLTAFAVININRSQALSVAVDGQTLPARTQRARVGDVLAEMGLALAGQDYSLPAPDQPLPADGLIRVVRVREEVLTEQESLPFETRFQALPEVELDNTSLVQAGAPGLQQRVIRVRYEDGQAVSRVVEAERVVQTPQARIIGYGARIVVRTLATPDGTIEYWRAYAMYATSYSASRSGTPVTAKWYGHTRSGKVLTKGMVAIDLNLMPLGTQLYVPGYGYASAEDTGGGVKGRWIDLGYDDWNYVGWHQKVTVYFLTPVPPASQITWIIPATVP
jgi:uncharacterized protein YabE (DUF348 family)